VRLSLPSGAVFPGCRDLAETRHGGEGEDGARVRSAEEVIKEMIAAKKIEKRPCVVWIMDPREKGVNRRIETVVVRPEVVGIALSRFHCFRVSDAQTLPNQSPLECQIRCSTWQYPGATSANSSPAIVFTRPVGPPAGGRPYFRINLGGGQSSTDKRIITIPARRTRPTAAIRMRRRTVRFYAGRRRVSGVLRLDRTGTARFVRQAPLGDCQDLFVNRKLVDTPRVALVAAFKASATEIRTGATGSDPVAQSSGRTKAGRKPRPQSRNDGSDERRPADRQNVASEPQLPPR